MNCKTGDLAILVRVLKPKNSWLIGRLLIVGAPSYYYEKSWAIDPPLLDPVSGREFHIKDEHLRPIRNPGHDAADETLSWLPVPSAHRETETS